MQHRGLVKWTAIIIAVICAFYLSFTIVGAYYSNKAKEYAQGDVGKEIAFMDSLAMKKVWLGNTLKDVRQKEIGLGLDLKGGMNVILELNSSEVIDNLANHSQNPTYRKALEAAIEKQDKSSKDFVTLFIEEFKAQNTGERLSGIFGTLALKDRININSTDEEVEEVLRKELEEAIESSHKVLRTRIDRFGVVAPNIQKLEGSDRILVELPGIKEPERVRKLLQGSANLEFWETYLLPEIFDDLVRADELLAQMAKSNKSEEVSEVALAEVDTLKRDTTITATDDLESLIAGADTDTLGVVTGAGDKTTKQEEHPLFALLAPNVVNGQIYPTPVVGMAHASDIARIDSLLNLPRVKEVLPRNLQLKWGVKEIAEGSNTYQLYAIKATRRDGQPALSGDVVTNAEQTIVQQRGRQEPTVSMSMNAEGAREWARLTKANIGRPIAIVLDNVVYSAPNVNQEIPNGSSSISGDFTIDEATDLANTLKSGKMAASVRIVQEDVVGPSLGQEAIQAGFISFLIAVVLLMIYICSLYGFKPGMVVNVALIINLFFTLGVLASLHAVLTLAGIAGMVLTLGMAVDANVLIFERIKEELRNGKKVLAAIQEGYAKAFSAIIDSNITTILTGIILYYFGSGPIRGFATTLIIGLIASFLTAVFLTRVYFESRASKGKLDNETFDTSMSRNFLRNPKINFIGKRGIGFGVVIAILVAGAVAFSTIGLNSGIDFTGGRNYIVKFDKEVSPATIASHLRDDLGQKVTVITIGSKDQVRISTNYKVEENTPEVDAEIEKLIYEGLKPALGDNVTQEQFIDKYVISSQKVGASMADDITRGALIAVVLSLIVMAVYILARFRDIAFSVGAFASVTFTTLSIIALYALLWKVMPFSMEIDQTFIAAVLAIIGYSINDTIVVFDRVRETLYNYPDKNRLELFNESLNNTLTRTINTTTTTLLVVLIIFFFGGASIRSFIFALILGIVFGTFSTLFVATPIAYLINKSKFEKRKAHLAK